MSATGIPEPSHPDDHVAAPRRRRNKAGEPKRENNSGMVLQQWRTKILNAFLIIVAVAATAMTAASVVDAISRPGQWPCRDHFRRSGFGVDRAGNLPED